MPHPSSTCLLLGTLALAGSVMAQPVGDAGKLEYDASCANCHGLDGKGNGPVSPYLIKQPLDLTTLSRRHGGAFPNQMVWEMIDGRASAQIGPHGSREMPIWGMQYRLQAAQAGSRTCPSGMCAAASWHCSTTSPACRRNDAQPISSRAMISR